MSQIQSVVFPKNLWSEKQSEKWLSENNLQNIKPVDYETKDGVVTFLRYRITEPNYKNYITKKVYAKNGKKINLIIGYSYK
jgi:hypothetical protein